MQGYAVVHGNIVNSCRSGYYKFILLKNKPDIDYFKLVAKNPSGVITKEIWIYITSVEKNEEDNRWKCYLIVKDPPLDGGVIFEMKTETDFNEWE